MAITLVTPIKQRQVEAYFKALRDEGVDIAHISSPEWAGISVRIGLRVGILAGATEDEALDITPRENMAAWKALNDALSEALEIPKN